MSDERTVQPDPVVRTALQLLPIPDHEAPFWDHLRAALDAEPGPAASPSRPAAATLAAAPAEAEGGATTVVELDRDPARSVLPPEVRRRSNAVVAAAAAAAAVLVVVAAATLVGQRGEDDTTTELAGTMTSTTQPLPASTAPPSVPALPAELDDASAEVVLQWVSALGTGDGDTAWEALGPAARTHLGDRAAFEDLLTELAEGYGAWSATSPDQVLVTPVEVPGGTPLVVVTLVGDVAQEGTTSRRADAFVVRIGAEGQSHRLEPFDTAGPLELVVPEHRIGEPGVPVVEGDELVIVVPDGVEAPVVRLDDGAPLVCGQAPGTELAPVEGSSGQRCAFTPDDGIPGGERVLTVAFVAPGTDGVTAESVRFEAA